MKYEKSCGAIVYRHYNDTIEFLSVKSKIYGHWGFPKGHIEEGESEQEAAKRELMEETELIITLCSDYKASVNYYSAEYTCKEVVYFIGKSSSQCIKIQKEEIEDYKWLGYNKMLELLTFDNDKKILIEVKNYLENTGLNL